MKMEFFVDAERVGLKRKYEAVVVDPDTLECPICVEPLSSAVYQGWLFDGWWSKCPSGHTACTSCWKRIKSKKLRCPSCSNPIGDLRNVAVEKILDSIYVSCKNDFHGCQKLVKYTHKAEHENELCEYQVFHCPVPRCLHEGSTLSIPLHFKEEHQVPTLQFSLLNLLNPPTLEFTMKSTEFYMIGEVRQKLYLVYREREACLGDRFYCACFGTTPKKLLKLYVSVGNVPDRSYMMDTKAHDVRKKDEWKRNFLLVPKFELENFEFHVKLTLRDI